MQIGIDPAAPGGDFTLVDLLYGRPVDGSRGTAHPLSPHGGVPGCMEARPDDNGVWVVEIEA